MVGERFPNAFNDEEFMFSEEFITKRLLRRIYYLRYKTRRKLNQGRPLRQNHGAIKVLKVPRQKEIRFGIQPQRYSLGHLLVGKTIKNQDNNKTLLKFTFLHINSQTGNFVEWNQVKRYNIILLSYNNYL